MKMVMITMMMALAEMIISNGWHCLSAVYHPFDHDYFFYHDNDDTPDYDTDLLQAAVLLLDQPGAAAFLVKASPSRSAVLTLLSSTKNMTP